MAHLAAFFTLPITRHLLWAPLSMPLLTACTTAPTSLPSPAPTQQTSISATNCCNADSLSDLATTELSSMQAQLDGMQEQINTLRNQHRALTQVISTRSHYTPVHSNMISRRPAAAPANTAPRLERARQLFQAGLYTQTVRLLKGADSGGNGGLEARHSMFLLMQSHWHLNNCESVINIGNRFAGRFASSPQAPEALYLVGQCQTRLQQKDIARTTWRKITSNYPNSPAAKRADKLLNGR